MSPNSLKIVFLEQLLETQVRMKFSTGLFSQSYRRSLTPVQSRFGAAIAAVLNTPAFDSGVGTIQQMS